MSEIEEKFEKAQQELVDRFKVKMRKASEEVLGDLYTDVLNYAVSDAHVNYYNHLRESLREEITKEVVTEYTHYSWASSIRMKLLTKYKDQLQNKIIEDLQGKIESLQQQVDQLQYRIR